MTLKTILERCMNNTSNKICLNLYFLSASDSPFRLHETLERQVQNRFQTTTKKRTKYVLLGIFLEVCHFLKIASNKVEYSSIVMAILHRNITTVKFTQLYIELKLDVTLFLLSGSKKFLSYFYHHKFRWALFIFLSLQE